jgi:hypothetical protein
MPITSGRVLFSRTIQVAQFEPKRAEVEISFEVKDGEVFDELLQEAKHIARVESIALVKMRDQR